MKSNNFGVYLIAVSAMLIWSISFVLVKIVYNCYTPFTVVFIRLLGSSILLTLYIKILGKFEKIKKEDRKDFLLLAFFEPFCYFLGESFGLQYVTATLGAIMISTIPLIAPIFGFIFLKEKVPFIGIVGIIISFLGVLLIVTGGAEMGGNLKGISLMMIAVISGTSYGILLRKLSSKYSSLTIVNYQNIMGTFLFLPLFLIFDGKQFITIKPDIQVIVSLIALIVLASCMAYIFLTIAFRRLGIYKSNVFTNLIPVFTAIFSYFILKENFNLRKIIGILIVITGLFISQLKWKVKWSWLHDW